MRKRFLYSGLVCIMAWLGFSCVSAQQSVKQNITVKPYLAGAEKMENKTAFDFCREGKIGWNVGNSLDAHANGVAEETCWGNPLISAQLMNGIAQSGFGLVRIPITWMGHIGTKKDGWKVDEKYLARVAEVVGYVHAAGMKAVINIHHDGCMSENWLSIKAAAFSDIEKEEITAQFRAVWHQIASYFANHGDYLAFEAFNELHDGKWGWGDNRTDGGRQYAIVNEWNQVFVDTVRASGGNNAQRVLVTAGYVTNPELTMEHYKKPNDTIENRLIVSVHNYDPMEYALNANIHEWGIEKFPKAVIAADGKNTAGGQEKHFRALFDALKTTFIDNGLPVYIGEYGSVNQRGYQQYREYYMEFVTRTAVERGILPIYWDNGAKGSGHENFGLMDRRTGKPMYPAVVQAMMRGAEGWK